MCRVGPPRAARGVVVDWIVDNINESLFSCSAAPRSPGTVLRSTCRVGGLAPVRPLSGKIKIPLSRWCGGFSLHFEQEAVRTDFVAIATRRELEDLLGAAVQSNPELRQELIDDPRGTLERLGLTDLPSGLDVRVVSEASSELTLVLPEAAGSDELSEAELDAVAGGVSSASAGAWSPSLAGLQALRAPGFAAKKFGNLGHKAMGMAGTPTGVKGPGGGEPSV